MGRGKGHKPAPTTNAKGERRAGKEGLAPYTVESLVAKAQEMMQDGSLELAAKFYERALEQQPNNTTLLDTLAELYMSVGEPELAMTHIQRSLRLEPNGEAVPYLLMGQLTQGLDAVNAYRKAISLLQGRLASLTAEESKVAVRQMSSANVSICELYMTDLCDEPEAEKMCEASLAAGQLADPGNPEVYQTYASLRLVQQKPSEAKAAVDKTLECLAACDETNLPSWAFQFQTAKLLLEVEQVERGIGIMEHLIAQNDQEMELWYLLGEAYHLMGDHATSLQYIHAASEMVKNALEQQPDDPELGAQLAQFEKLREKVQPLVPADALPSTGPAPEMTEEELDALDMQDPDGDEEEDDEAGAGPGDIVPLFAEDGDEEEDDDEAAVDDDDDEGVEDAKGDDVAM